MNRRKSDEMKKKLGTYQPCRSSKKGRQGKVVPISQTSDIIADMNDDAKKLWHYYTTELQNHGMLEERYLPSLKVYCIEMSTVFEAARHLQEEGQVITKFNRDGVPIGTMVNPWRKVLNEALKNAETENRNFGFTPLTSQAIHTASADEMMPEEGLIL